MNAPPVIIEVLSRKDDLTIRHTLNRVLWAGLLVLTVLLVMTWRLTNDPSGLMTMAGIFLLLYCNAIFFLRNTMMDRYIRSLYLEEEGCYLSTGDPGTCAHAPSNAAGALSPTTLYYKQETLTLHERSETSTEANSIYRVLSRRDWSVVKHLKPVHSPSPLLQRH